MRFVQSIIELDYQFTEHQDGVAFFRGEETIQRTGQSRSSGGPQVVVRGKDAVVVISRLEYERLLARLPGFQGFLMGRGPSLDGLALQRDRSPMRNFKP